MSDKFQIVDIIDEEGHIYKNVLVYDIDDDEMKKWKFVLESHMEDRKPGIELYQDPINPNIGYRLHSGYYCKDFAEKKDLELVTFLNQKKKVKLTKFPYGLIRYKGMFIGQIIPFFTNYKTLSSYIWTNPDINPFGVFLKVLNALLELSENGICYYDIKGDNFLICNGEVETIDFDAQWIKDTTNQPCASSEYTQVHNFIYMVKEILGAESEKYHNLLFCEIGKLDDLIDILRTGYNMWDHEKKTRNW